MSDLMKFVFFICFTLVTYSSAILAEEETGETSKSIELVSSDDFTILDGDIATFNIRPLEPTLRAIENLKDTEAVGISYLGRVSLAESATPLSVLRELSVQISSGLNVDLALITDSTTSKSLLPHEMLLLYHPQLVITLALTKIENSDEYNLMGTYAIPVDKTLQMEPLNVTQKALDE